MNYPDRKSTAPTVLMLVISVTYALTGLFSLTNASGPKWQGITMLILAALMALGALANSRAAGIVFACTALGGLAIQILF